MMKRFWRFNLHFVVLATLLAVGCSSPDDKIRKRQIASLRIHVEGRRNIMVEGPKAVFRNGTVVNILNDAALSDMSLVSAELVDDPVGGFRIKLAFDAHGKSKLEALSIDHREKRLAVFASWSTGSKDKEMAGEARWLAAPAMYSRNGTGILVFTPDATRAEAEIIVRGLNRMIKKNNE